MSSSRRAPAPFRLQFNSYGDCLERSTTTHFKSAKTVTAHVNSPLATLASAPAPEVADECMFQLLNALRDENNVKTVIDDVMITRVGGCDMVADTRLVDWEDVAIERLCAEGRCEKDEVMKELLLLQDQLRDVVQQNQTLLQTIQPQVPTRLLLYRRCFRPTPHSCAVHRKSTT